MNEINTQAEKLSTELNGILERIGFENMLAEADNLNKKIMSPDFWQDNLAAQATTKQQAKLEQRLKPWQGLRAKMADVLELARLNDDSLNTELTRQLEEIKQNLATLKNELKFNGPYDEHDAIINVYAGAGGHDAQDWADMLRRMYVRWAEKNKYQITSIDESPGEEGGIKSATLEIGGSLIYGKLKGEHGVHRLVRLSPFNTAHSRETSFAKVDVLPKIDQPDELEVDDKDLRIDVYRSGGHGGQSVNTTDSAVRITHIPTGITVAIQNERSQLQNKETAMTILRSRLAQLKLEQHAEKLSELKGPNQSAEFGSQIRNYVLHPYKLVKDLRTGYESANPEAVLDGDLDEIIKAYLDYDL